MRTTEVSTTSELAINTSACVRVFGPASISNLGPGFDTLGLCLRGLGDTIEARLTDEPGITIDCPGTIPREPEANTAARAAHLVLIKAGNRRGLHLTIDKGIPLGSGIGGSAASAAAGAWAANLLLGSPFNKPELAHAVLEGERLASGGMLHGDNALPALFGGLVLTSPVLPADYRRITLPKPLHLALLLPSITILTSEARTIVPRAVPLRDAVHNASDLAFLIHALMKGDWEALDPYMMRDRLVEPTRASLVPEYQSVRRAALDAGAHAVALTGSGPAMFAVAPNVDAAKRIRDAMVHAARGKAKGVVTEADPEGVRACA